MKLSVSLSTEDVEFLDRYAEMRGIRSRSAAVQEAIAGLRAAGLGDAYADAWQSWTSAGDAEAWEPVVADGLEA